jgi:hypothetical protein
MTITFDQILTSDDFYQDPHTVFHQLRQHTPVYWSDGWGAWVLTRYDDVMQVLRQTELFSSAGRVTYLLQQLPADVRAQVVHLERHYEIGLAHSDPPDHTRLRGLLNRVFTPRMVETWRPRIEAVVQELIDEAKTSGDVDIIRDLAYPLPATIIAEMIGASPEDIPLFRDWAADINRLFALGGRISAAAAQQAQDSLYVMRDYITGLVEARRSQPADDIIGRLVAAETDGEKLTINELVSTCVTLFVAGHETTTNLIGNGMFLLLSHPEVMRRLRNEPGLIESAVEEVLRCEPSVPRTWRIAREDTVIGTQHIHAGAMVFPILSAANRDPAYFDNPDQFDIRRKQNKHLAFGYGIHFCLGAPLARVEGAIAIDALLQQFPNIELAHEPTWHKDIAIRSLNSLKVRL